MLKNERQLKGVWYGLQRMWIGHNAEEARHYVGVQLCNFLKNRTTKENILNDHWMNQYLDLDEIRKAIETVTANAADVK